jgi:hypothetical protein
MSALDNEELEKEYAAMFPEENIEETAATNIELPDAPVTPVLPVAPNAPVAVNAAAANVNEKGQDKVTASLLVS